jgi:hypothetical protein
VRRLYLKGKRFNCVAAFVSSNQKLKQSGISLVHWIETGQNDFAQLWTLRSLKISSFDEMLD